MGLDYDPDSNYDPNDLLDMRNVQIGPDCYNQSDKSSENSQDDFNYSYDTSPYISGDDGGSWISFILNMIGGLAVLSAMFGPREGDIASRWYCAIGLFAAAWLINKIKQ